MVKYGGVRISGLSGIFKGRDYQRGKIMYLVLDLKTFQCHIQMVCVCSIAYPENQCLSSARTWPIFFYRYIVPYDDRLSIKTIIS